jgi:hypothetical protein
MGGFGKHPLEILDDLHHGEISVGEAVDLLRGCSTEEEG